MTIGVDIRTLMDKYYSGVSNYTFNLLKQILIFDNENKYKLFYNSFHQIKERLPEFKQVNAEIIGWNYPNKLLNYFCFKLFNQPKIDVKLGVDLFFMPHINLISLSGKKKSVLTVHDLSFLRQPEFFNLRKNIWHSLVNVKKLLSRFDKIIAVSENTKNDIMNLCQINENKIKVIYSGIDEKYKKIPADSPEMEKEKIKYNLPEKFILFLGNLEPRKNVSGIIMAYDKLRSDNSNLSPFKLIIAGQSGWKSKNIFNIYKKAKFREDIKFINYVSDEDKVYLYNLASVFIFPSFYEGFGFPPLEAMASGTPVVASFTSSLPEILGDAALLVDPYNIADISQAMAKILTSDKIKSSLIKKGLAQASQFRWDNCAKEYLAVFRAL